MKYLIALFISLFVQAAAAGPTPAYERLDSACAPCVRIDKQLSRHSAELNARKKAMIAIETGKIIGKIRLKGNPELEQKRMIYYSLRASVEMMSDDFENEIIIGLIDLRTQAVKVFDSVFWTFPMTNQHDIRVRMGAMMDRKLRKSAPLPALKEPEN